MPTTFTLLRDGERIVTHDEQVARAHLKRLKQKSTPLRGARMPKLQGTKPASITCWSPDTMFARIAADIQKTDDGRPKPTGARVSATHWLAATDGYRALCHTTGSRDAELLGGARECFTPSDATAVQMDGLPFAHALRRAHIVNPGRVKLLFGELGGCAIQATSPEDDDDVSIDMFETLPDGYIDGAMSISLNPRFLRDVVRCVSFRFSINTSSESVANAVFEPVGADWYLVVAQMRELGVDINNEKE